MAYIRSMEFIETKIFTKQITGFLPDEEYKHLQQDLIINPEAGDLIRNSGGLRKVRWKLQGKGKSGGIRVIYYWYSKEEQIFMLLAYGKNQKDNLSDKELSILRKLTKEMLS